MFQPGDDLSTPVEWAVLGLDVQVNNDVTGAGPLRRSAGQMPEEDGGDDQPAEKMKLVNKMVKLTIVSQLPCIPYPLINGKASVKCITVLAGFRSR